MLVKYEFLKILRKKSTLIVMVASLLVTAFLFGLPILRYQTYNQDGVIKGFAGIEYERKQAEKHAVPLTDEYITDTIREVQQLFDNPDNVGYDGYERFLIEDAYWNGIAPRENLLGMIAKNYADPNESVGYNALPDLDISEGTDFYGARQEKIERLLNDASRALSEEQKAYWRDMNSKAREPFTYGYFEGWEIIISSFELLMFALLAVCIVIAPVFSGEYQAGTDAVILSAKYGKTKLTTAKIIASYLFGCLAFTLHVIVAFGLLLAAFGFDGWDLPLQIANTTIPYPFTFLQAVLVNLGVVYLVLFAMISLTLLLSAKMKSPYLVLIVLVPVLFIPMFLSPNGTTGIYNLTLFLLPYRSTMPEVGKYISYQFRGLVLDAFAMRAILYALLTAAMLPLARLGFKKHQVA
ncbi:MAG: ABC transporter permease subunit [Oscillospiraceae bacterium]|nr:ABC transporter permease subunit [Oscillospiraceae bacterium]